MRFNNFSISTTFFVLATIFSSFMFTACSEDNDDPLMSTTFEYQFHNGQVVPSAPYIGTHASNLTASLKLEELKNGNTNITVTINNTIDGEIYHTHAHDGADPATTPNGTPYNESPNTLIYAQPIMGNGGSVSVSQEATESYSELISAYEGFFVIHDPLQAVNTANISSYVVVGLFARSQTVVNYSSSTFQYDFNIGQIAAGFAYAGTHPTNLGASITVDELAGNKSRVTVRIMNSIDGETYHTHAHDVADPTTTPNGTPYDESPNGDVFVAPLDGNGGTTGKAVISPKSFNDITATYEGFFVIHDPLQVVTTLDPTTYVILGSFAR